MVNNTFFNTQITKYKAIKIKNIKDAHKYPDNYIWFETRNFGWILLPIQENGKRKVVLQY